MKMRNICATFLALVLTLTLSVPSFASEGGEIPTPPVQEPPVSQQPESGETTEPVDPAPLPDETTESVDPSPLPDEAAEPADPVEPDGGDPEAPPVLDGPQDPDSEPVDAPAGGEILEEPDPDGEEVPAGEDPAEIPEEMSLKEETLVIDVMVPTSGQVVINPYHMPVSTSSGETTDQIVNEPQELVSYSDFPVLVSAQVVGTLRRESAAYFVSEPPAGDTVDKEIFMYAEFQTDPALWSGVYGDLPNQILVTDWGAAKEDVMALDAFGVGYFRLFGALASSPDEMWEKVDAPDVTLVFTFAGIPKAVMQSPEDPEETPEAVPEDDVEIAPETIPEENVEPVPEPTPDEVPETVPNLVPDPIPGEVPEAVPGSETVTSDPDTAESAA